MDLTIRGYDNSFTTLFKSIKTYDAYLVKAHQAATRPQWNGLFCSKLRLFQTNNENFAECSYTALCGLTCISHWVLAQPSFWMNESSGICIVFFLQFSQEITTTRAYLHLDYKTDHLNASIISSVPTFLSQSGNFLSKFESVSFKFSTHCKIIFRSAKI